MTTSNNGNQPKRGRGRPATSHDFTIVPIPHPKPDAGKLGRAFLNLALYQAEQQAVQKTEADDESA